MTTELLDGATRVAGVWPEFSDIRFYQLLRHWAEHRQGLMTPRSAIDPIAIKSCLPNVWMMQHLADSGDFRCTLAGEAVNQAWGQSIIGKRACEYMPASMQRRAQDTYRLMLSMPALQVSHRPITRADAMQQSAERLVLPVSDEWGKPYGVFGMTLYFLGTQSRIGNPQDIQGDVAFYPCATLPAGLPGA